MAKKKSTKKSNKKSASKSASKKSAKPAKISPAGSACSLENCGPKCLFSYIGSSILLSVGLFMIVAGVMLQSKGAGFFNAVLWYLGGFLLMMVGKSMLWKACMKCYPR